MYIMVFGRVAVVPTWLFGKNLQKKTEEGEIKGFWVQGFGGDLHLHLSTTLTDSSQISHLEDIILDIRRTDHSDERNFYGSVKKKSTSDSVNSTTFTTEFDNN